MEISGEVSIACRIVLSDVKVKPGSPFPSVEPLVGFIMVFLTSTAFHYTSFAAEIMRSTHKAFLLIEVIDSSWLL